jgi:hypothetical protein
LLLFFTVTFLVRVAQNLYGSNRTRLQRTVLPVGFLNNGLEQARCSKAVCSRNNSLPFHEFMDGAVDSVGDIDLRLQAYGNHVGFAEFS